LVELRAEGVNQDLLEYMASYEGLKVLTLMWATGRDAADSDHLAGIFFNASLPKHYSSLKVLQISATYCGGWCFGSHNSMGISACKELRSLRISVHMKDDKPRNVSYLRDLLDSASKLPRLQTLSLAIPNHPGNRFAHCGNPSMHYKMWVCDAIQSAMANFEALAQDSDPYPKFVEFSRQVYRLSLPEAYHKFRGR